jgi:acyl carrier protein
VKVRGFRIELGEIAIQLLRHPQVSDAVVIAREDLPGDKRLVAYVTTRNGPDFSSGLRMEDLRAHLESVLPEYMIPSAFIALDSFPLTTNGKLDRQALPAPDSQGPLSQRFEPPRGEMEEALAAIWQDVLRVEKIGREHKFLELGGHSVQGMRVVVRVAERFGIQMSFPDLFQHPTIRQMAEFVQTLKAQTPIGATQRALTQPA